MIKNLLRAPANALSLAFFAIDLSLDKLPLPFIPRHQSYSPGYMSIDVIETLGGEAALRVLIPSITMLQMVHYKKLCMVKFVYKDRDGWYRMFVSRSTLDTDNDCIFNFRSVSLWSSPRSKFFYSIGPNASREAIKDRFEEVAGIFLIF